MIFNACSMHYLRELRCTELSKIKSGTRMKKADAPWALMANTEIGKHGLLAGIKLKCLCKRFSRKKRICSRTKKFGTFLQSNGKRGIRISVVGFSHRNRWNKQNGAS